MITRYSRPEMVAIWSPQARFRIWFEIEAHACDALAELGVIPAQAARTIWEKGGAAVFDIDRIDAIERETKHDVIAFLTHLAEFVGPDARFIHQGMTSSDVLDTCLSIQLVRAADLLIADVDALLAALDAPNPLKDWRKALQTGRAKRLLGQSAAADAAYSQAVSLAQADPESALEAVAFLGKAGERDLFESALSRLLLDPAQASRALQTLMPAVRGWRDTAGLRKFSDLLAAAPGLSEDQRVQLQNEIVYCDLVLGRKVASATIESLSTQHPGDMRFQITQALALLRAGQSDLAVDELVITQAPPDDPFLLARHKAVQAMALAASGDRERARMHFENLSGDFLSPQETALARSYLKK